MGFGDLLSRIGEGVMQGAEVSAEGDELLAMQRIMQRTGVGIDDQIRANQEKQDAITGNQATRAHLEQTRPLALIAGEMANERARIALAEEQADKETQRRIHIDKFESDLQGPPPESSKDPAALGDTDNDEVMDARAQAGRLAVAKEDERERSLKQRANVGVLEDKVEYQDEDLARERKEQENLARIRQGQADEASAGGDAAERKRRQKLQDSILQDRADRSDPSFESDTQIAERTYKKAQEAVDDITEPLFKKSYGQPLNYSNPQVQSSLDNMFRILMELFPDDPEHKMWPPMAQHLWNEAYEDWAAKQRQ
jgi:hypothetical protein